MGKGMIMASERLGNIEDLSYKDDISLFSQIGEYSQKQPFRVISIRRWDKSVYAVLRPPWVKNHAFLLPTSRCRGAGIRGHQPMHHRRCAPPAP